MNYTIAFVGNPNVGKSAWINALSQAEFKVGNWPGVTVEKKEACVSWQKNSYNLIDLPGTYALQPTSNEENITARFLSTEKVDLIVNIVDATNLQSHLLLTLYLRELQIPMFLIFNFMDEVEKLQIHIDIEKIARRLQIEILPASVRNRSSHSLVQEAIIRNVHKEVFYYPLLEKEAERAYVAIYNYLKRHFPKTSSISNKQIHQYTLQFLIGDPMIEQKLSTRFVDIPILREMKKNINNKELELQRYQVIHSLMKYVSKDIGKRYALSRKIDAVLLHRYFGLPIFLIIFSFVLYVVFQMSAPFNDFIAYLMNDVGSRYVSYVTAWLPEAIQKLLLDGVLAGVGGVLVFMPLMAFLYFMLSLLEESGYMARISFLLDRAMRVFHLSGKSFISLLLGFGCNVPAIYATRTLDNEKQKRLTALLIPFMSCGARLPVYMLFAAAFFRKQAALMVLSVYGLGIFFALLFALIFSRISFMKDDTMFLQELPPYRMPSLAVIFHKVKEEVKGYVQKAMGIVLWAMIILWSLSYFPNGDINTSYIAKCAHFIQPVFEPLGFGTRWETIASLPGGIIAKETIVGYFEQVLHSQKKEEIPLQPLVDMKEIADRGLQAMKDSLLSFTQMKVSLHAEDQHQSQHIASLWTDRYAKLRAFSFMVYVLLSIPCIMSLQALYHEYGKKMMILSILVMSLIPYLSAFLIFQIFSHVW